MSQPSMRTLLVVAALDLAAVVAHAEPIPATTARNVEVTVFRDRAEIIREATVDVPAGASTVEFAEIPAGVEPDSLRVSATGVQAMLGAVTLADRVAEARETPELVAARDELRRLEDAQRRAAAPFDRLGVSEPEPSPAGETEVVRSAYNVAFEVVGRSDVPADGREHRVVLRSEDLAGKLVHRTVPSADPRAYLTSVTTSPAGYPLLAGPARVFAGGAYLGSFAVEEAGPGSEWTIPFGVDNRLEVVRVPLPREAGREGIGGRQRTLDVAFTTTLTNRLERATTVVLEDRIPVSEDERVVIELDKATTAGWKPSERRPGVMLWTLDLERGEKREIVLAYSVRAPRELIVPGLE